MNFRARLLAGIVILVFALGTTTSFAQFGGWGGKSGGARSGNRNQGNTQESRNIRPPQQENDTYEQMEYRLQLLEEDLHLLPDQRNSWDSFAGKVRAYAGDLARARARAMTSPSGATAGISGVQHIEQAADAARNRATALDEIAAAATTLYAVLKPEQKMLADLRIASFVAPQPRAAPAQAGGSNLPDLGSSGRMQR